MAIDAKGAVSGFVVAPAFGSAVCVAAMMVHFVMTDAEGAALTLGELLPVAGAVFFSALMFAYPAAVVFVGLWLVLRMIGLGVFAGLVSGSLAGFGAMGAYLHRLHGGSLASALSGGQDLAALTLPQLPGAFALPLIGAGAGLVASLLFMAFAKR